VCDEQLTIGHVGDTRLYEIRRGSVRKLTHDHSPVGEREDTGELDELDAMRTRGAMRSIAISVPNRTNLTTRTSSRSSSSRSSRTPHSSCAATAERPRHVRGDRGAGVSSTPPTERVVEALVAAANDEGGKDNVTVVFVAGPEFADSARLLESRAASPIRSERPRRPRLSGPRWRWTHVAWIAAAGVVGCALGLGLAYGAFQWWMASPTGWSRRTVPPRGRGRGRSVARSAWISRRFRRVGSREGGRRGAR